VHALVDSHLTGSALRVIEKDLDSAWRAAPAQGGGRIQHVHSCRSLCSCAVVHGSAAKPLPPAPPCPMCQRIGRQSTSKNSHTVTSPIARRYDLSPCSTIDDASPSTIQGTIVKPHNMCLFPSRNHPQPNTVHTSHPAADAVSSHFKVVGRPPSPPCLRYPQGRASVPQ
jgi:hypothetical protein